MQTTIRNHNILSKERFAIAAAVLIPLMTTACGRGKVQAAAPSMPAALVGYIEIIGADNVQPRGVYE